MHQHVPGYSDTPLYEKYPLKYMNRLKPFDQYDTDALLPRIHAAEFLGEPQYGGGRPVPPQEAESPPAHQTADLETLRRLLGESRKP